MRLTLRIHIHSIVVMTSQCCRESVTTHGRRFDRKIHHNPQRASARDDVADTVRTLLRMLRRLR